MAFPILGTAQLGMAYGVANRVGRPERKAALAVLEAAAGEGITAFDTAAAYGDSESILGEFIDAHGLQARVNVITKLRAPDLLAGVERAVESSLRRLRLASVDVLLLHEAPRGGVTPELAGDLEACRADGRVRAVGVSVYEPGEAAGALASPPFSVVQVPTNVFDHRFIEAGLLGGGAQPAGRVDVRSIFLQGLLALDPEALPPGLGEARGPLLTLRRIARREGCDPLDIACAFARDLGGVSGVLFGAETPEQVRENAARWLTPVLSEGARAEIDDAFRGGVPLSVIDPRRWPAPAVAK